MMEAAHLNLLPVESRGKLLRQTADKDALHAALLASGDAEDIARAPLTRLKHREADLLSAVENAPTHPHRLAAEEALAALREEMAPYAAAVEHRKAAKARAEAAHRDFDFLAGVREFLSDHRLARLHAGAKSLVRVIPPNIGKVVNLPDEVAKTRTQVAAKVDEIERTRLAPVPVKDQLAAAFADLDQRAERGRPDYDPRRRDKPAVDIGRMLGEHHIGNTFAWLHRDALAERIKSMIGTRDAPGALTDDQREKRLAQLEAEKLHLERVEEQLIVAAEAIGQRIARRRDASPLAILEIE